MISIDDIEDYLKQIDIKYHEDNKLIIRGSYESVIQFIENFDKSMRNEINRIKC